MINALIINELTPSIIMYGFGLLFGILSVLYFAKDILLSLSITTKSYSLFLVALFIFSISTVLSSSILSFIIVTISGFAYSVAVLYRWRNTEMERIIRFSILFASSLLLILVARGIQSSWFTDNYTIVLGASVIGFVLFILMSIIDVKEEEPIQYEFELVDTVETTGQQTIGNLKVSNQGRFTRSFDLPNFRASYKSEDSEVGVPIQIEGKSHNMNSITRNTTREYDVSLQFDPLTDPRRESDVSLQDSVKVTTDNPLDKIIERQDINVVLKDS